MYSYIYIHVYLCSCTCRRLLLPFPPLLQQSPPPPPHLDCMLFFYKTVPPLPHLASLYKGLIPSAASSEIKWLCKSSRPCLVILISYTGWNVVIIGEVIIKALGGAPPLHCLSACSLKGIGRQTGPYLSICLSTTPWKSAGHGSRLCDKRRAPNWRRTDYVPEETRVTKPSATSVLSASILLQRSISPSLPPSLLN